MLCVTGVYSNDITFMIFLNFALECESSEHLLFLFGEFSFDQMYDWYGVYCC